MGFCLVLLLRVLGFGDHSQQKTTRDPVKRHLSLITTESFAFLNMPTPLELENDSPFFKSLVASRRRPWARILAAIRNPRTPTTPRTRPGETEKPVTTTTPKPTPKPPDPTAPRVVVKPDPDGGTTIPDPPEDPPEAPPEDPRVKARRLAAERRRRLAATRIVTYLGSATTGSGVRAAYVQVQNAATKVTQLRFLTQDEALGDVKVVGFDAEALQVVKGDGSVQRIAFGTAESIVLEH